MALVPQISLKTTSNCKALNVYEQTGVFVTDVHETGWGTDNVNTGDLKTATVYIYNTAGTTLIKTIVLLDNPVTVNVFSATPDAPFNTEFQAFADVLWEQVDGIYKVIYKVIDNSDVEYTTVSYELFTCKLCACKNNLVDKLVHTCDTQKVKSLKEKVDQMELFLYGIQTAFACGDFTTANTILTNATTYCETISNCGCGC